MFHNYFFLKRLASQLDKKLKGLQLFECFSQNKNELILGFVGSNEQCYISANLDPIISLLRFNDSFSRAGKNSIDLFKELVGLKVKQVSTFQFERSFMLTFESEHALVFKLHNRSANLLLIKQGKVVDVFRKKLSQDLELDIADLHKPVLLSKEVFLTHDTDPLKMIPALGKEVKYYFQKTGFYDQEVAQKWIHLTKLLSELDTNPIYLLEIDTPRISLLEKSPMSTQDAIEAANWLYEKTVKTVFFEKEKEQVRNQLKQSIKKSTHYIQKTRQKLDELEASRNPEEIANIIMANLNALQTGLSKAVLNDFYTNSPIEIKLKTSLSPQKNAENYYRKSKNRHQEITSLNENIDAKESLIDKLSRKLLELEEIDTYKDLRKFRKTHISVTSSKHQTTLPYHEYESEGWIILVGKNSKANDELTLKVANKNDLWLHAKDVTGSHVIIKEKPGQNFPNTVIEYAASLAAANSKRKTDTLCPVIYTPKKFVRKTKGSPAGQVIVTKEMVLMVEPYGT